MNDRTVLLVDFNNILYRSVFANQDLSYKGQFTGGIYGFINMISSTVNRYSVDRILVCDDAKPYIRADYYSEYKQDRKELDQESRKQISVSRKQIKDFLAELSFPIAKIVGYEADDFIGKFCRARKDRYAKILIMSNDSDFYQLLGTIAGQVYLVKTQGLYGLQHFKKEFPGLVAADWPTVIALKGSHNGVAGIKGVGEITAVKMIREKTDNPKRIHVKYGSVHSPKKVALRVSLATFPFPLMSGPAIPRTRPITYDAETFEEVCDSYGIQFKTEFHTALVRLSK